MKIGMDWNQKELVIYGKLGNYGILVFLGKRKTTVIYGHKNKPNKLTIEGIL